MNSEQMLEESARILDEIGMMIDQVRAKTSRRLAPILLVAPPPSSIADLAHWYGRGKEIWPEREIIVTVEAE